MINTKSALIYKNQFQFVKQYACAPFHFSYLYLRTVILLFRRKRQVSTETCRFQLYSPYGELYAPSVRDICFASDMPAGVRGEYNITETVGFNITFCVAKYITPSKMEYH